MALREVVAFLGFELDSKPLEKGSSLVDAFKGQLLGVGAAIGTAFAVKEIVGFGKTIIDRADEVREAGIALGIVPQHLQQLEFAAGTAGVEMGELRASLAKFNKTAAESAGGKGAAATFDKLGVSLKNADGSVKSSGDLFEEAGVALGKIEDPIERAGLAGNLFGKSYAKLLPLFAEGKEGIEKLKKEARDLGLVFDDAFLQNADAFNDNLKSLKGGVQGLAIQAIGPILPDLVEFTKRGVAVVKMLVGWVKSTKIIQAATVAFAGGALVKLAGSLGRVLPMLFRFAAPLLAIEDALVFLAGGKSVTGTVLDKAFGPGTQEKVRAWIGNVGAMFRAFFDDLQNRPKQWKATIKATLQDIFRDISSFLGGGARESDALFDALTGDWENFTAKMGAAAMGLVLPFQIAWENIRGSALISFASIADAAAGLWNTVLLGASNTLMKIGAAVAEVPGMADVGKELVKGGVGVLGGLAATDREQNARAEHGARLGGIADKARAVQTELDTRRGLMAPVSDPSSLPGMEGFAAFAARALTAEANRLGGSVTTNNVSAPVNVQQSFTVNGNVAPGTVRQLGKTVKGAATAVLDLAAAKAAGARLAG